MAKYLKDNVIATYSAYWCQNCLNQSELFGKQAYRELNVVECAGDGKNNQNNYALIKKLKSSHMGNKRIPYFRCTSTKRVIKVYWIKELSKR